MNSGALHPSDFAVFLEDGYGALPAMAITD